MYDGRTPSKGRWLMDQSGASHGLAAARARRSADTWLPSTTRTVACASAGRQARRASQAHCAALDPAGAGAVLPAGGQARGFGELRPDRRRAGRARPRSRSRSSGQFQGRGIGGALLRRLTLAARNRWIRGCTCSACSTTAGWRASRVAGQPARASTRGRSRPASSCPGRPAGPCPRSPGRGRRAAGLRDLGALGLRAGARRHRACACAGGSSAA